MEHQDFKPVTIGKPVSLKSLPKKIVPKNTTDMHKIKIENETENFNVVKIPSDLSKFPKLEPRNVMRFGLSS